MSSPLIGRASTTSAPTTRLCAPQERLRHVLEPNGFNTLFLGLGAVGVASIMAISVLERRREIRLRRVLGAAKGQIRIQVLAEVIPLALAGGLVGSSSAPPPPGI